MEEKLSKLEISIVIPVFNEAENIHFLSKEITKSLKNFRHEIIFVDDGSSDDTRKEIKSIANELNQIRLLSHKKSLGQSVAMRSGIIHSKSNLIATLDGDGQNVPSDLPSMISTYKNNKDGLVLVAGVMIWNATNDSKHDKRIHVPVSIAVGCAVLAASNGIYYAHQVVRNYARAREDATDISK